MKPAAFALGGRWLRGNLHTHSTNSDGSLSPARVCAKYRRRGYDFVAITDHFMEQFDFPLTDTTRMRRDGFTTLFGAELHAPKTSLGDIWHILAVGLPLDFARTKPTETGPQLARRASRAGAYVAAAHPAWYDLSDDDVASLDVANAIEIHNTVCDKLNGKGDGTGYLDRLMARGIVRHGIATDDAHFGAHADFGQNWVMVRSRHNEPQAILDALHDGAFYSSQGPEFYNVKLARGRASISCSPVRSIFVNAAGFWGVPKHSGRDVTEAEIDVRWLTQMPHARITIVDARGRKAHTNPFGL